MHHYNHLSTFIKNTFYILLITLTLASCKKSGRTNITIIEGDPVVNFEWAGGQTAPATIVINNNSQNAKTFKWDFGNGQSSTKQTPDAVTYTQPGTYDIVLSAGNSNKTILLKKTIVIAAAAEPEAQFSYEFKDQRSAAPATLIFTNNSVNATQYEWDINGMISNLKTPNNVTFNQPGDYKIKLKATKNGIAVSSYERTVTILANPDPVAKFVLPYHPYPYTAGEEIQLVNLSENSDAWQWTFGANGPAASTEKHPVIKFAAAGNYTITLVALKGAATSTPKSLTLKIN